jgi:hypothetical protein
MSFNINNPIGSIIDLVKDGLDKWGPADKTAVAQMKAQLDQLKESDDAKAASDEIQLQLAALANVQAEAKGESWLQRNWRPMTALFLVGLVGAYWFGWTAPNLTQITVDDLFGLVKICLGGYYASRGMEKIAPHVVEAVRALKS